MEQYSFHPSMDQSRSNRRKWWLWGVIGIMSVVAIGSLTVVILNQVTPKKVTTPPAPSVTMEVTVDTAAAPTASIKWSGLQASSYELQCATTNAFSDAQTSTVTQPSGTCSNLQTLQTYYVRVRTTGGIWSKPNTFATGGTTLLTVGVQVKRLSSTSAQVTWQKAAGVETYQLQYSTDKSFASQVETQSATGNVATIQGLTSQASYYVRVKAVVAGVPDKLAPYSVPAELK